jgi:hypothetical protein
LLLARWFAALGGWVILPLPVLPVLQAPPGWQEQQAAQQRLWLLQAPLPVRVRMLPQQPVLVVLDPGSLGRPLVHLQPLLVLTLRWL